MTTLQTYASLQHSATPLESSVARPIAPSLPTGSLYLQLQTLQNVFLLAHNPHMVAHHRHTMTRTLRELEDKLDSLIEQIDPVVLEALSSHPVNAR